MVAWWHLLAVLRVSLSSLSRFGVFRPLTPCCCFCFLVTLLRAFFMLFPFIKLVKCRHLCASCAFFAPVVFTCPICLSFLTFRLSSPPQGTKAHRAKYHKGGNHLDHNNHAQCPHTVTFTTFFGCASAGQTRRSMGAYLVFKKGAA